MFKLIRKIRLIAVVVFIVEILYFVLAMLGIYFDYPKGTRTFFSDETWLILFSILIGINLTLFWVSFSSISRIRQKADLTAAQIIGGDVQEAYNFSQLGLLVADEKGTVLWTSELFAERNIKILDENLYTLYPALYDLNQDSKSSVAKIEINSRKYEVKYLPDASLFIFKDTTEFDELYLYSKNNSLVIGILSLDNYNDLAGGSDDNNDVFTKVKQCIADYAKDFDVFLRKYRNDAYLMICNYYTLNKLIDDKFSILTTVKNVDKELEIKPTLSIGIAYDFPDATKMNDMASNALDIALSRGGDQVVISQYGEELQFFGGNTVAVENNSKVKIRSVADSIISLIKSSTNVFIMGHQSMDLDALGACLGVKAICDYYNVKSKIVSDSKKLENKTRIAMQTAFSKIEFDDIFTSPKNAVDELTNSSLVVVCDTANPDLVMSPTLVDRSTKTIIIDHHRRGENFIENSVLAYIDPSASSACEIVTEMIKFNSNPNRIVISEAFATLMLSGIFLDTNFFKAKSTGKNAFEAAEYLKSFGADNAIADDYLKDEYEEFALINSIVSTMKTPYFGVVYCVSNDEDIIDRTTLAKAANQLLQLKGINACFVIGRTKANEVRVSGRSDGTINVQLLAEKMGGGGHFTMAAAAYTNQSVAFVESQLIDTLDSFLQAARSDKEQL